MASTARDALIETAQSYLAALVSHDAESARLAPGVRRIDNGKPSAAGAEALRAILRREPVGSTSGERWLVDGEQGVVFYDLAHDPARAEGRSGPAESWMPVYVGERFQVRGGQIHEIEVVYWGDTARKPRPQRPAPSRAPRAETPRDVLLAACRAYLAALVSHEASRVPLAPDAWRVENGANSGASSAAIASSLESPLMKAVAGIDDVTWFAERDQAASFYTLRVQAGERRGSCRIAERFRVRDGELVEIEAVVSNPVWSS
jgi:hypothetical protein